MIEEIMDDLYLYTIIYAVGLCLGFILGYCIGIIL